MVGTGPTVNSSVLVEAAGIRWHVQQNGRGAVASLDSRHRRRHRIPGASLLPLLAQAFLALSRPDPARAWLYAIAPVVSVVATGHVG